MGSNPWLDTNLDRFLFFCCPECNDRTVTKVELLIHAIKSHANAKAVYKAIELKKVGAPAKPTIEEDTFEDFVQDIGPDIALKEDLIHDFGSKKIVQDSASTPVQIKTYARKNLENECQFKPKFQCYYCSEMIEQDKIEHHMKKHPCKFAAQKYGPRLPYSCQNCSAALKELPENGSHQCHSSNLKITRTLEPRKINEMPCKLCSGMYNNENHWALHMKAAHGIQKPFECSECDMTFSRKDLMRKHVKAIHLQQFDYVCSTCGKRFFEGFKLKAHERTHEEGIPVKMLKNECPHCHKVIKGKSSYNSHLRSAHGVDLKDAPVTVKKTPCDKCGLMIASSNPTSMTMHKKMYHPSVEDIAKIEAKCTNCNQLFGNAHDLNNHQSMCLSDLKNFECIKCQCGIKQWHSANALQRHLAESHQVIFEVCPIEGCILTSMYPLSVHVDRVHLKVAKFECKHCKDKFVHKAQLKRHILQSHDSSSIDCYRCDKCSYVTLNKLHFSEHMNAIHDKSVKYKCDMCDYATYRKGGLSYHIKMVHQKYKPHKCDICDMSFGAKKDFRKHNLTTHGILEDDPLL